MKILIEISEEDYHKLCNTEIPIAHIETTLQGRVYSSIVFGEVQIDESDC